ncbi:MAG: hydroxymethylbilane synthase [Nitrospirae bacterium]|nr:hydroxymethylbilane synthase [Nitrospirota bacterium]
MKRKITIGTRSSKLALWQAEWVKSELKKLNSDLEIELKKIKTTGDKILDVPLAKIGGKGLFVKEIEEALLRREADLAVHSMKDVPTDLPQGLHISAICKRENPRDALIVSQKSNPPLPPFAKGGRGGILNSSLVTRHSLLYELPHGATIGTSSLRRICQILSIQPNFKITQLRGNLDTRIRKLDEGKFDAIIVAVAGVKRLGLSHRITETLEPDICLPAIGQGAVGIECRTDDKFINSILSPLNHVETSVCVKAERAFLKRLEGGCQVPIAAYARIEKMQDSGYRIQDTGFKIQDNHASCIMHHASDIVTRQSLLYIDIDGLIGSVSGDRLIKGHIEGNPQDAEKLGVNLAEDLLSRGGEKILAEIYPVRSLSSANHLKPIDNT